VKGNRVNFEGFRRRRRPGLTLKELGEGDQAQLSRN